MVRVYYGDHFEHPSTHEHLTTPETVAKFVNLFLSFILMMGGIATTVIGIWLASTANEYNYFINSDGLTPTALLIAFGLGLFFFSSVACCATARHSGFLLGVVVVTMFLLVCGEIVGVTFGFSYSETLKEKVRNDSLVMIANYSRPGWEVNATEVFDRIQKDLSCCGLNTGPSDWSRDTLIATFWIRNHTSDTPDSCCITPTLGCGEGVAISPNITLIHNKLECCGVISGPNDWKNSSSNNTLAFYWVDSLKHNNDVPDSCCVKNSTNCGVEKASLTDGKTVWNKGCVAALFDWIDDRMLIFVLLISFLLILQIINVCGMYLWRRCIVHGF